MIEHVFPHLNAGLNSASALLLLIGYMLIRRGRWYAHAVLMILAAVTSAAFLACYLVYHYKVGEKSTGNLGLPNWLRLTYFAILLPHVLLAVAMLPMILMTFLRAWRRDWAKHRKIAKPTYAVWMFVSVTGVVVYGMLYHLFPLLAAK